jgi:hypothetical protein
VARRARRRRSGWNTVAASRAATTALNVTIQKQILELIDGLRRQLDMAASWSPTTSV